jgi:hypothetical protein
MARHLASCPKCTEWARRALELDQAWEATRPEEPAAEVFDSVWAGVCRRLDAVAAGAEVKPVLLRSWRHWVLPITGLVQVAAVVVAGFVLVQQQRGPAPLGAPMVQNNGSAVPGPQADSSPIDLPVSGDQLMVIKIQGGNLITESLSPAEGLNPTLVAGNFEMLGPLETMGQ